MKHKLLLLVRWIVGLVFVFSGFVKGIDPMGFTYKINDYLEAMHLRVLEVFSFPGALILPFAEFAIGITLLTGILVRFSIKLAFIFMLFFTPLTLYIALKNPVTDCGCFGDALVISNWQTFYKNIILIFFSILLLLNRNKLRFLASEKLRNITTVILLLSYFLTVYWSYNHEPLFDFRPYKIGVNIPEAMIIPEGAPKDVYKNSYSYRNLKSNELKKFSDEDFPWRDTINWKFDSMDTPLLIKKGYKPPIHDFSIQTAEHENVTEKYLNDSLYTFLVIAYDLEKSSHKKQKELNLLASWAKSKGFYFICLTSTTGTPLQKFLAEQQPSYEIMFTDQITLKTIIRSNPGLIMLKRGTIIGKWHYNDLPTPKSVEAIIDKEMNKKLNR